MALSRIARRHFFERLGFVLLGSQAYGASPEGQKRLPLARPRLLGKVEKTSGPALLPGAVWYVAQGVGDGFQWSFEPGFLKREGTLSCEFLLDGDELAVFFLKLQEGQNGRVFIFKFGLLNQCSGRLRVPLSLLDTSKWRVEREGAILKPYCRGSPVELSKVDRASLVLARKGDKAVRWCMTPLAFYPQGVAALTEPVLPKGPLLDRFGQSTIRSWPSKTKTEEELRRRLQSQLEEARRRENSDPSLSRWGGWRKRRLEGSGFFRTHFNGRRWYLVDPDGFLFWSAGIDCVRVDTSANYSGLEAALSWKPDPRGPYRDIYDRSSRRINYLAANFIRVFGPRLWHSNWARIALSEIRRLGFNTVGNWSEWEIARKAGFPYVRPLSFRPRRVKKVFRDFPDVFDPAFEKDAADYASQLGSTAEDPTLLGYFMMNEPKWGFASEVPAAGMLRTSPPCATRRALLQFLKKRYRTERELVRSWGIPVSFSDLQFRRLALPLGRKAASDLEEFSVLMVKRFFTTLSNACKRVDPNHLNLGIRYAGVPPRWALAGMESFDVFSMNCYRRKIPAGTVERICKALKRPVLIGEWHFGALDVGLPASGIGRVGSQEDRGRAYRVYFESAASNPYCVGVHWFTLYDQSALGRFDGENYNIGFFDVCNRPYEALAEAARKSHKRLYELTEGKVKPYKEAPRYLPSLF